MKLPSSDFFPDLYRDLRDRRLLLPIALLAVALVAVPMVLGSGSEPAPPPAPAPVDADAGAEVAPAVLAEQAGIRNYHKRLAQQKKRNPFTQKFVAPDPAEVALVSTGGGTTDTSSTSTSTGGGSTSVTDTSSSSTSVTTDSGVSETTTETTSTTTDSSSDSGDDGGKPQVRFYAGRAEIALGPLGDVKTYSDVRYLDFLPSEKRPLVSFITLDGTGEAAVFALSNEVVETSGDGRCTPHDVDGCELLRLKVGEQRTLKTTDGETYRLKLLDTRIVRVPDPRDPSKAGPDAG